MMPEDWPGCEMRVRQQLFDQCESVTNPIWRLPQSCFPALEFPVQFRCEHSVWLGAKGVDLTLPIAQNEKHLLLQTHQ